VFYFCILSKKTQFIRINLFCYTMIYNNLDRLLYPGYALIFQYYNQKSISIHKLDTWWYFFNIETQDLNSGTAVVAILVAVGLVNDALKVIDDGSGLGP
jgi:hypothetical protein